MTPGRASRCCCCACSSPPSPSSSSTLTSVGNPTVKQLWRLRRSGRLRRAEQRVVLCGEAAIADASAAADGRLDVELLLLHEHFPGARALAEACRAPRVVRGSEAVMRRASGLETAGARCAVALARLPPPAPPRAGGDILVLDGVADPGNLGTILRSAAAFGWTDVWALPGTCDPFNDKALQAGRGSQFVVNLNAGTWEEMGTGSAEVVAVDARGEPVDEYVRRLGDRPPPRCLVLGNEGQGLSDGTLRRAGATVSIEMDGGTMESLNVGVAAGILMHSLRRRRR